jgi:hypothetical protein
MTKPRTPKNRADKLADSMPERAISYPADHAALSPEEYALSQGEPPHEESATAVAVEVASFDIAPRPDLDEIPGEDALLRSGDPDVDPLNNELSGEEMPGGANPTPDQNDVDEIGRAYGLSEQGEGPLRSVEELMDRRDAHRWDAERREPGGT